MTRIRTWGDVLRFMRGQPKHSTIIVPRRGELGPPQAWPRMRRSAGLPKGQLQDWRCIGPDGGGLHVLVYRDRYVAHYDTVDPAVNLLGHLKHDVIGGDCCPIDSPPQYPYWSPHYGWVTSR